MWRSSRWLPLVALLGGTIACNSGRHSSSGFRLPMDGDVEHGKATFVSLGCPQCHTVTNLDLPKPTIQPPVPVVLGGVVTREITDGYLVTSIVNPSYALAPYHARELITAGGKSRMPDYSERMTVRQLVDTVAFLQSRYTVVPPTKYQYSER